jgi:hypothetical protein
MTPTGSSGPPRPGGGANRLTQSTVNRKERHRDIHGAWHEEGQRQAGHRAAAPDGSLTTGDADVPSARHTLMGECLL